MNSQNLITCIINDSDYQIIEGTSLEQFLNEIGYQKNEVAVDINGNIIMNQDYSEVIIEEKDNIQILTFVGGG